MHSSKVVFPFWGSRVNLNLPRRTWLLIVFGILVSSCNTSQLPPYPRPIGFARMELPTDYTYTIFSESDCPFSFAYPEFGEVSLFRQDSCWVDIYFPPFNCTWHITYRPAKNGKPDRDFSLEEHRQIIYKHSKKASNIATHSIAHHNGYGTFYEVFGNVGTPSQLFYSDSSDVHILMTSFYYNASIQNDSLVPVSQYMKKELQKMAKSIEWE
ncbi:MAG: hypothetical protein AAF694_24720 [Bacteroidota bacterium]